MKRAYVLAIATLVIISLDVIGVRSEGNPSRGQRVFGACAACHSLQPDQDMTGPSLADLWNRKAGRVASFSPMGGMGGMMGGGQVPNLKHPDPAVRVQAVTYCKDTYTISTANGQTRKFWERNIRLKTDSSGDGPEKNAPGA